MKIAHIIHALEMRLHEEVVLRFRLLHTGEHNDVRMPRDSFEQLGIPIPDIELNVGSVSHAEQAAAINVPANLRLVGPQLYLEFNWLIRNVKLFLTDSCGIAVEATVMGVPFMTLRNSSEWPETIHDETSELTGTDPALIGPSMDRLFAGQWRRGGVPPYWHRNAGRPHCGVLERLLT